MSRRKNKGKEIVTSARVAPGCDSLREREKEIAELAYLFWEQRDGVNGSAEEDWRRAEAEVAMRYKPARRTTKPAGVCR